ncbi:lysophospholipid acyltransferase family protein [Spiribacter vilamensis]|uniref:KDO2-lipid IV(A) lauroyltransferase n=1 Tax=Spiribacter vilamensis TaxID=531306 RepID=A0A4Q8D249_9GAMM|nr:lysophospholipid acyltransferase family protein [Spiribacter vilamensis]RZU99404.1 KDO2-lipid IV(A) lauroyltransferase [Spiribacter vilamensis]
MSDSSTPSTGTRHRIGQRLSLALLWMLGKLPPRIALFIGETIGRLFNRLPTQRRRVAQRNLELCFPELGQAQREHITRANLRYTGRGIAETALAWFGGARVDHIPCDVHGLENLEAAQSGGSPVILLSGHFLCIELAARLIGPRIRMAAIYKPMRKKPLMDRTMLRSRSRTLADVLPRTDLRKIVRVLRQGTPVWYAGDQDYGVRNSEFVSFMGVQTPTTTGLMRLSRMSSAKVVPLFFNINADGNGYEIWLEPAMEGFPTGNDRTDAQWMNAVIERGIRAHPEQYLWLHRRFKHPPPGERPAYGDALQKPRNRYGAAP